MPWKSSSSRYGGVAIAIHWITAVAILGMLISGLAAERSTDAAGELTLLRAHAVTGVLVGLLTVLRIVWWLFADRRPPDQPGMPALQARASRLVHGALYVVILVMVGSGMATLILTGANQQLFGAAALPLPDFGTVLPFRTHDIVSKLLIALLIGHIGAALYHQFILRDRLLARMGLGR
tara:strand:- start:396 stop:932 length:537 start_codon:yes stop_codon:yes gene_type:complete